MTTSLPKIEPSGKVSMTTAPEIPSLSVGSVLGDSDAANNAWLRAIRTMQKRTASVFEGVETPLRVNVVFHVDGKLSPNEFAGVRTGRYSRTKALLMVQAAVPPQAVPGDECVLERLLIEAVKEAEKFAVRRGLANDLHEIQTRVAQLPFLRSGAYCPPS